MDTMTGMTWSKRPSYGLLIAGIVQLFVGVVLIYAGLKFVGILFWVGIFEIVLGVVLIGVGVKARGRAAEAGRLKATGLQGQAAITEMRQTGVTMNEQPQVQLALQVTVPGHPPYAITKKEYVPLMLLGTLTSGRPLPVSVDPLNLQNVVINWENALSMPMTAPGGVPGQGVIVGKDAAATPDLVAQGAAQGMLPSESEMEYKRQRLRQFGKPGTAVVQSVQDTGQRVGSDHVMVVDLVTTIDGVTKDIPASAAAVPEAHVSKVQAGVVVPLRVDQQNADEFTLLWEEAKHPSV